MTYQKKPQDSESRGTRNPHDGVAKHVQHVGKTELKFVISGEYSDVETVRMRLLVNFILAKQGSRRVQTSGTEQKILAQVSNTVRAATSADADRPQNSIKMQVQNH